MVYVICNFLNYYRKFYFHLSLSFLRIQTEGLGGLRHNTIIINWPDRWNKEYFKEKSGDSFDDANDDTNERLGLASFVQTLRFGNINGSALIITKGVDSWPVNSKSEIQNGTIDLWWIIHDGGLLLLIVFLLKKHKIWQKCKLRLFTVARENEHSVQIKNDLVQYMYHLRIDAEVDVIEMVS
jgi:potassium/chloride transporter 4/5/6